MWLLLIMWPASIFLLIRPLCAERFSPLT